MKVSEIRELTEAELRQKLSDARQELFNLRVQQSSGRLEKPSRVGALKRDIARINTVIRQQALAKRTA
ncbi:MAG: 50S ribosomal protein L29 [Kiritimatiellae bacterium]|nr:50S ribosomal protein L29 [Kiritimatiellia bacterium]MCO5044639.1 50S ribosomal protein L29 [Kiritimatiellia bacterium]MCO5060932.1 50S ribosomal protein L29 [Kiritimatiellia bacterium]MCO5068153.1 50S ribosomal protein L29 [Kiritimatiellia bacterium]MCO6400827.1 50S ribosomal protein L29 [Verrucomicrobiota bacterium]